MIVYKGLNVKRLIGLGRLVSLCNLFVLHYRTIELFVLHLRAKTRRVNRTSIISNSNLLVEMYFPSINCWRVTILLLNLSNASNLLYTGLRLNLTLLTVLSFRHLPQMNPFWVFFKAVLGCKFAAIWRMRDVSIQLCHFSNESCLCSRGYRPHPLMLHE